MMRKCFSLLIRLLVKITKLSKATQETTQPISPITSQINGPAENNAHGLKKYRIGITFLGENLRRIWGSFCLCHSFPVWLSTRQVGLPSLLSARPCADSDLRSFYLTALSTPASCGQNTRGRACFMNILPDTNTSRFRGNFQEYSSGKVISLAQKQFLLTRALKQLLYMTWKVCEILFKFRTPIACIRCPFTVTQEAQEKWKSLPSILLAACPVSAVHWPVRGDIFATRRGLVSIQQTSYLIITQVGEPETGF